jgi:hypothetical protein
MTRTFNVGLTFQRGNGIRKSRLFKLSLDNDASHSYTETDINSDVKSNRIYGQVLGVIYNEASLTRKVIKRCKNEHGI